MYDGTGKMLKRFRRQFVLANMVFAVVVLGVVVAVVASITYSQRVDDIYEALDMRVGSGLHRLAQGGSLSGPPDGQVDIAQGSKTTTPTTPEQSASSQQRLAEDQDMQQNPMPRAPRVTDSDQIVATALYLVVEDGTVLEGGNDALLIDEEELVGAIDGALQAKQKQGLGDVKGYLEKDNLYFKVAQAGDSYIVGFASGKYIDRNLSGFFQSMLLACLGALVAFFLVSIALAHFVIEPVQKAWNKQQQFVADASHELKTPLTVIMANDSILLSQPDASIESQRQWIESNEIEAHAMQELINDMLYLAKSDADEHPLEHCSIDFSGLVNSLLLQFESVAFEKGALIEQSIQDNVTVYGNTSRLRRLVSTLMENACKYVDEDGSIQVDLYVIATTCVFKVCNSGSVVDADDIEHLFDRFFRSDKARTRGSGVGLGLAIAKSVVDEHKGAIHVASNEEMGTMFTVELPVAQ